MNYSTVALGPVYKIQGVPVTLTIDGVDYGPMRMLDKSNGISLPSGKGLDVETIRPAAFVRAADLIALELDGNDLDMSILAMNGKTWRVSSVKPFPSPNGETDGQFCLFIEEFV